MTSQDMSSDDFFFPPIPPPPPPSGDREGLMDLTDAELAQVIEYEEESQQRSGEVEVLRAEMARRERFRKRLDIPAVIARKDLSSVLESPPPTSSPIPRSLEERRDDDDDEDEGDVRQRKRKAGTIIEDWGEEDDDTVILSSEEDDDDIAVVKVVDKIKKWNEGTSSKKVKLKRSSAGRGDLSNARTVAADLRDMPEEKRIAIDDLAKIGSLPVGTVLEVSGGELVETVYGESLLIKCSYFDGKGKRVHSKMHIPSRYAPMCAVTNDSRMANKGGSLSPRVMVYLGEKLRVDGKHTFQHLEFVCSPTHAAMKRMAGDLRKKTVEELQDYFRVRTLSTLPKGSVLVVTSVRSLAVDFGVGGQTTTKMVTSGVAAFETIVDGKEVNGEVFLPHRYISQLEGNLPGVVIYKGSKSSKTGGREYYDCCVLDRVAKEQLLTKTTS